MLRVLLGIVKGGLVGAAIGLAATKAGIGGPASWLIYGVVGFLTGVLCGKAIWRQETLVTPILKGVFGVAVGMGLYWLSTKLLSGVHPPAIAALGVSGSEALPAVPALLAPLVGVIYGIFIEVDDGERKAKAAATPPK